MGLKCVKGSQQDNVTIAPYSSLDSGKYKRRNYASKVRNYCWWENIFKAKMSYGEKLWNVFQRFLKAEDSLIQLGWHTHHLPWAQEWAHCTHKWKHSASPPPPPHCMKCSLWKHLPFLLFSSRWSPRCPFIRICLAAPWPILMLFPIRPTLPGAACVFVLLFPHKNLLPQPMSQCIECKLIQGHLETFSPQTPVHSYHLLAFPHMPLTPQISPPGTESSPRTCFKRQSKVFWTLPSWPSQPWLHCSLNPPTRFFMHFPPIWFFFFFVFCKSLFWC